MSDSNWNNNDLNIYKIIFYTSNALTMFGTTFIIICFLKFKLRIKLGH
jgi:hypothetical protein